MLSVKMSGGMSEMKSSTERFQSANSRIMKWKIRRRWRSELLAVFDRRESEQIVTKMNINTIKSNRQNINKTKTKTPIETQNLKNNKLGQHSLLPETCTGSVLSNSPSRRVATAVAIVWLVILLDACATTLASTRPPGEHAHWANVSDGPNQRASQMRSQLDKRGLQQPLDYTDEPAQDIVNSRGPTLQLSKRSLLVTGKARTTTYHAQQDQPRSLLAFGQPEPPPLVEYSNSSGATIQCRPATPDSRIAISWRQLVDGTQHGELFEEREVARMTREQQRQQNNRSRASASEPLVRPDGALVLPAFDPTATSEQIVRHRQSQMQTFRCCLVSLASDATGAHMSHRRPVTLCSRLVTTRAVIDSHLPPSELVAFDKLARPNQMAILKCRAPAHLWPHLELINWLKDDKLLSTVDEIRLARRLAISTGASNFDQSTSQAELKYLSASRRGELIIRNVSRHLDAAGATYKCRVRNKLTGRVTTSQSGAKLIVVDEREDDNRTGGGHLHSVANLETTRRMVVVAQEHDDLLLCAEFAHPIEANTRFLWSRVIEGRSIPIGAQLAANYRPSLSSSPSSSSSQQLADYKQLDACLLIGQVQHAKHSGEYTCDASGPKGSGSGGDTLKQTFQVFVSSNKLDVQMQVLSGPATSQQMVASDHEDRLQQQSVLVTNNANPSIRAAKHFVAFGSSVQLNCSSTLTFATGGGGEPTRDRLWQPQADTIVWFKDSKLLFASNSSTALADDSQPAAGGDQTLDNIRIVQPNVIIIEPFNLHNRGIYQCLMFSSLANVFESPAQLNSKLSGQVRDFFLEVESGGNRSVVEAKRDKQLRETSEDFRHEVSLLTAQLVRGRQSTSAVVSVHLDVVLSKPQLVQKFPVASSHQTGTQMSLECSASGVPLPKIIWLLDDFLIKTSSSLSGNAGAAPTPVGAMDVPNSDESVRELVSFVSSTTTSNQADAESSLHNAHDDDTNWAHLSTSGTPDAQSNQILNSMDEEPRFRVTNRLSTLHAAHVVVVVSQLNVSNLQQFDSGHYKCLALNAYGQVTHSGHVLVLPRVMGSASRHAKQVESRPYQPTNITLLAGVTANLHCPLVGHQVARIDWYYEGQRLPASRRQRLIPVSKQNVDGGRLEIEKVDASQDGGVYTCQAHLDEDKLLDEQQVAQAQNDAAQLVYNLSDTSQTPTEARMRVKVHVPPLIDVQSLPEVVQATEGMRTKLVCSIVQGDPGPTEIRWLRRTGDPRRTIKLTGGRTMIGYESMQNVAQTQDVPQLATRADESDATLDAKQSSQLTFSDSIMVHNLDDSCLLTFKQISHSDSGDYVCLAQNQLSFSARQVRVVVSVPPSWSLEPPEDVYVLQYERLQLDCLAYGHPTPVASWRRASAAHTTSQHANSFRQIPQLPNGTLVIDPVDQHDAGLFMCEQTNGIGSGLSRLVHVHVQVPPHFLGHTSQNPSQKVTGGRLGGSAELKCLVLGDQPLLVGWRKEHPTSEVIDLMQDKRRQVNSQLRMLPTNNNDQQQQQQQGLESTLNLSNLSRQDSGTYSCIASNEFGTREHHMKLIVQEPPEEPQLMRPIKAESRQATLTFRQPFDGNSPISRYAIHYRHLSDWHSSPASSSWAPEQGEGSKSSGDFSDQWKQVLVDAPPGQQARAQLQLESQLPDLVNVNLCCLKPFSRYAVRVRALNEIGPSEPSKPVRFQTQEETIGGPPLDVSVEPTGAHSLKVRWREPALQLQNGLIRGYYIGYRALMAPSMPSLHPDHAHLSPPMGGAMALSPPSDSSEQFQYKNVQLDLNPLLVSSAGDPLTTEPAQFADPAGPDLPEQRNFMFTSGLSNSSSSSSSTIKQQSHLLSTYLTNLRRKTSYSIIVQAYNKVGAGPRSDQILVSTLDAAPPMSPLLKLLAVTHNSAHFAWSTRKFNNQNQMRNSRDESHEMARTTGAALELDSQLAADEDDDPQAYYTLHYKLDERYLQFANNEHNQITGGRNTAEQVVAMAQQQQQQQQNPTEWQQKRVTKASSLAAVANANTAGQQQPRLGFVLAGLRCGSAYLAHMTATNSLGQSEPGEMVKFATRGGAPVAPQSSRDFLSVNTTYLIMRLDAWHAPGCPIRTFAIKYKLASQAKWTILEHQVYPTIQTITIAGTSVFSTRPPSTGPAPVSQLINGQQMASEAVAASARLSGDQIGPVPGSTPLRLGDFILRNLLALAQYKLIVEANSEAGSSVAEYEFDTTNLTSSMLAVQVNGLVAADQGSEDSDDPTSTARMMASGKRDEFHSQERGNSIMNSFSSVWMAGGATGGGGSAHYGRASGNQHGLGVWSLTVIFVAASILMAITTLVLGAKSLLRLKQARCRAGHNSPSQPEGLVSALLCCSSSSASSASSSSSSGADSHSSTRSSAERVRAPTSAACYGSHQAAPPPPPSTMTAGDIYCSLPNGQQRKYQSYPSHIALTDSPADFGALAPATISGLLRDNEPPATLAVGETSYDCAGGHYDLGDINQSCARSASQMVGSASLSAILNGQQHRYAQAASLCANNAVARHALTLAPIYRMNRTGGSCAGERAREQQQQQQGGDNTLRLNSHYAATLGRQQQQQQSSFGSPMSAHQPIKFNQSHTMSADTEIHFNELFSAALKQQHQQSDAGSGAATAATDRMTSTSGYVTSASLTSGAGSFNCSQQFGGKQLMMNSESCNPPASGGFMLDQQQQQQQQLARTVEQYELETTTDGLLRADASATCYAGSYYEQQRTKHNGNQGQLAFGCTGGGGGGGMPPPAPPLPPVDLYGDVVERLQIDAGHRRELIDAHTNDGITFDHHHNQNSHF